MSTPLDSRYEADSVAKAIANKWSTWQSLRDKWLQEKKELREYLFATSTKDTSNKKLPWKNSTVTPKLTQIRDNLHANYMAALFPREQWFVWQAADNDSVSKEKKDTIQSYMLTKLQGAGDFERTVSQLVLDYIDYGNAFVGHHYCVEKKVDPKTGEEVVVYQGPKAYRISPLDINFDPTACSFREATCIVRRLVHISELAEMAEAHPELEFNPEVIAKLQSWRMAPADQVDALKNDGLLVDGFGTLQQYIESGMVELLHFYGEVYDPVTKTHYEDMVITVADRRWTLAMHENKSWTGERPIKHVGWRLRPDNLWAQGPLDQLVGMQYRIDHLENLKADVFDQIAHPLIKVKGSTVDTFVFGPGQTINCGDDGDVEFMRPDATALSADMEIQTLMDRMEELAGAPRQAMGIRTPGEKTKYEVQVLENGAGRIFQSKVQWFERNLIEPLLNSMLEEAVRCMGAKDAIRRVDPDYGTEKFTDIVKTDITARGKFRAVGARHFAEQAMFTQELTQTLQLIQQLPQVAAHISGKAIAKALEETMGWKSFGIIKDNALIQEQADTKRLMDTTEEQLTTEAGMPTEMQPGDVGMPQGGVSEPAIS
jgi:hypothetical protein